MEGDVSAIVERSALNVLPGLRVLIRNAHAFFGRRYLEALWVRCRWSTYTWVTGS